jgi:hypothetical protein
MHMRHRTLMLSGSAAVVVVGIAASAAFAAPRSAHAAGRSSTSGTATWSVSQSVNTTGSSKKAALVDTTTGTRITCSGVGAGFGFTRGMGLDNPIATMSGIQFSSCALPGGAAVTVTANQQWDIMGVSFNKRRNLGVTSGDLTGIDISISSSGCSGVLDGTAASADNGTANYQFYNNPGFLIGRTGGSLHIYNVSGCTGVFNAGDTFTLSYTMGIGVSGLFITSP